MELRRVAISVQPRLLADTLRRALERPDVDVVVVGHEDPLAVDIAIITGDLPDRVTADVVVRIPDAAQAGKGSITTPSGRESAVLNDLAAVLEALDRFLGPS